MYSNAVEAKGSSFVQPLKNAGKWQSKTIFFHGTSQEGVDGITKGSVWLGGGHGDIRAGFFLLPGGQISQTYANKGGKLLEVFLDPSSRTFVWDSSLVRNLMNWLEGPGAMAYLKNNHKAFHALVERGRIKTISRDDLARSFGAQVLVNRTLYGGSTFSEIVVLDPTVVRGVREIARE